MPVEITEEKYEELRQRVMRGRLLKRLDQALAAGWIDSHTVEELIGHLDRLMMLHASPARRLH